MKSVWEGAPARDAFRVLEREAWLAPERLGRHETGAHGCRQSEARPR